MIAELLLFFCCALIYVTSEFQLGCKCNQENGLRGKFSPQRTVLVAIFL